MSLKGCIFDLDGVLVDTARFHYLAWRRLALELGFSFSEEHNEALKGVSRMASLEILLSVGNLKIDEARKEILADRKNQWYVEYISSMTPGDVLPGSLELLKALRKAGILIGLGSASKNAGIILGRTKLLPLFNTIIDGTRVHKAKPDPEVFLTAADEMNILPDECIVIEDARAGIEAARAAGMKCVGIGKPSVLGNADLVVTGVGLLTVNMLENLI